jgi:hypothetical protein
MGKKKQDKKGDKKRRPPKKKKKKKERKKYNKKKRRPALARRSAGRPGPARGRGGLTPGRGRAASSTPGPPRPRRGEAQYGPARGRPRRRGRAARRPPAPPARAPRAGGFFFFFCFRFCFVFVEGRKKQQNKKTLSPWPPLRCFVMCVARGFWVAFGANIKGGIFVMLLIIKGYECIMSWTKRKKIKRGEKRGFGFVLVLFFFSSLFSIRFFALDRGEALKARELNKRPQPKKKPNKDTKKHKQSHNPKPNKKKASSPERKARSSIRLCAVRY